MLRAISTYFSTAKEPKKEKLEKRNSTELWSGVLFGSISLVMIFVGLSWIFNSTLVEGMTSGYCSMEEVVGIEFEYQIENTSYSCCQEVDDTSEIVVPNGVYKVRVNRSLPSLGIMIFDR